MAAAPGRHGSFEASVQCLRTRYSSPGATSSCEVSWKGGHTSTSSPTNSHVGSPAFGAIRCELGVHQEWEDSAHGARGGHPSPLIAQDNHGGHGAAVEREGWSGEPNPADSEASAAHAWRISLPERTLTVTAVCTDRPRPLHTCSVSISCSRAKATQQPSSGPAQRSSWLVWVTVCFEHLSRTAVGLIGSDDVEEMKVAHNRR